MKDFIRKIFYKLGYRLSKVEQPIPYDMRRDKFEEIYRASVKYTGTNPECLYAMHSAVLYAIRNNIPGAIVECGVSRAGMMILAALTLNHLNVTDRELWLYDTFTGMARPDEKDTYIKHGQVALKKWLTMDRGEYNAWEYAPLEKVQEYMRDTKYSYSQMKFIKGKVEKTIPQQVPDKIAVLRLDTDWYASTKHELEHLYPRLSPGGVLLLDDYGTFQGARDAVDEYIKENNVRLLLNRVDNHGSTVGIKV